MIPKVKKNIEDKDKRFYVIAPSSVYIKLQNEAYSRGTDLWTLAGSVLSAWIEAGSPDDFLSPRSSPSPVAKP